MFSLLTARTYIWKQPAQMLEPFKNARKFAEAYFPGRMVSSNHISNSLLLSAYHNLSFSFFLSLFYSEDPTPLLSYSHFPRNASLKHGTTTAVLTLQLLPKSSLSHTRAAASQLALGIPTQTPPKNRNPSHSSHLLSYSHSLNLLPPTTTNPTLEKSPEKTETRQQDHQLHLHTCHQSTTQFSIIHSHASFSPSSNETTHTHTHCS